MQKKIPQQPQQTTKQQKNANAHTHIPPLLVKVHLEKLRIIIEAKITIDLF